MLTTARQSIAAARTAVTEVPRVAFGALVVALLLSGSLAVAPAAFAADSTVDCMQFGTVTTPVALTVGDTYTILNSGTPQCSSVSSTSGTAGTVGWASSNGSDLPASNPTTLRSGATLTVTMLQVGTQTLTLAGNGSFNYAFTVTLPPAPSFSAANPPTSATVGTPYPGYSFAASGTGVAYSVASGGLPPGITLAANGALTGTATTAGTYTFVVAATNSGGTALSAAITITVAPAGGGSSDTAPVAAGPAPWLQSYGRLAGDSCKSGWHSSWAEWAVAVTGGWVCNRTVFWDGSAWLQNPNAVWGSLDANATVVWDGS